MARRHNVAQHGQDIQASRVPNMDPTDTTMSAMAYPVPSDSLQTFTQQHDTGYSDMGDINDMSDQSGGPVPGFSDPELHWTNIAGVSGSDTSNAMVDMLSNSDHGFQKDSSAQDVDSWFQKLPTVPVTDTSLDLGRRGDRKTNYCVMCEKRFSNSWTLKRHMRVHQGDMPYSCPVCGKGFMDNWNLQNHVNVTHNKKKDFKCPLCNAAYGYKRPLQLHMRSKHNVTAD